MSDRSETGPDAPIEHPSAEQGANDEQAGEGVSLRDPHVARALQALRASPGRAWTVAALARIGGLSRAAFAKRFTDALGSPPLRWLTTLRLELAQRRLCNSDATLSEIASELGYSSDFALAKAFKRELGIAPGAFRRRHKEGATSRPVCLAAA